MLTQILLTFSLMIPMPSEWLVSEQPTPASCTGGSSEFCCTSCRYINGVWTCYGCSSGTGCAGDIFSCVGCYNGNSDCTIGTSNSCCD